MRTASFSTVATMLLIGWATTTAAEPAKQKPTHSGKADVVVNAASKAAFDQAALKAKGLILVDFYADWCPPCRQLGPLLAEIAQEQAGKLTVVKVNVDKVPELAQQYQVKGIPHLVLLRDGKTVDTQTGFRPKEELLKWLAPQLKPASN